MKLRLADIKEKLISELRENDYGVKDEVNTFLKITDSDSEKTYIIDNRDHTGPILLKSFIEWIEGFDKDVKLIFITMGFFHEDVYKYLIEGGMVGRLALLQFGQRSIYDDELHTGIFGNTSGEVFEILIDVVGNEMGIEIERELCAYCDRDKVVYCEECLSRLCSEHFIPCPLCRAKLCHPDTGERCYYEHNC